MVDCVNKLLQSIVITVLLQTVFLSDVIYRDGFDLSSKVDTGTNGDAEDELYRFKRQKSSDTAAWEGLFGTEDNRRLSKRQKPDSSGQSPSGGKASDSGVSDVVSDSKIIDNVPVDNLISNPLKTALPQADASIALLTVPGDIKNIKPCDPNPCQNGGTCHPDSLVIAGGFQCACPLQFRGKFCHESMLKCSVIGCTTIQDCMYSPAGGVCVCMGSSSGRLCLIDVGSPSDWNKVKMVVTEKTFHEAEVILAIFGSLSTLFSVLIGIHCYRVNSRRAIVRKRYKDILKKGQLPNEPPPDWCDISNDLIKQTLFCKKESSLVDDYRPEKVSNRTRVKPIHDLEGLDQKQKDEGLEKLLSQTHLPEIPPEDQITFLKEVNEAWNDGQVSPNEIDREILRRHKTRDGDTPINNNSQRPGEFVRGTKSWSRKRTWSEGAQTSSGPDSLRRYAQSRYSGRGVEDDFLRLPARNERDHTQAGFEESSNNAQRGVAQKKLGSFQSSSVPRRYEKAHFSAYYGNLTRETNSTRDEDDEYADLVYSGNTEERMRANYYNNSAKAPLHYIIPNNTQKRTRKDVERMDAIYQGEYAEKLSGHSPEKMTRNRNRASVRTKMVESKENLTKLKKSMFNRRPAARKLTDKVTIKSVPKYYRTRSGEAVLVYDVSSGSEEEIYTQTKEKKLSARQIEKSAGPKVRTRSYDQIFRHRNINTNTNTESKVHPNIYEQYQENLRMYLASQRHDSKRGFQNGRQNFANSCSVNTSSHNGAMYYGYLPNFKRDDIEDSHWYWSRQPLSEINNKEAVINNPEKEEKEQESKESRMQHRTGAPETLEATPTVDESYSEYEGNMKSAFVPASENSSYQKQQMGQKQSGYTNGSEVYGIWSTTVRIPPSETNGEGEQTFGTVYGEVDLIENSETRSTGIEAGSYKSGHCSLNVTADPQFLQCYEKDGQRLYYFTSEDCTTSAGNNWSVLDENSKEHCREVGSSSQVYCSSAQAANEKHSEVYPTYNVQQNLSSSTPKVETQNEDGGIVLSNERQQMSSLITSGPKEHQSAGDGVYFSRDDLWRCASLNTLPPRYKYRKNKEDFSSNGGQQRSCSSTPGLGYQQRSEISHDVTSSTLIDDVSNLSESFEVTVVERSLD